MRKLLIGVLTVLFLFSAASTAFAAWVAPSSAPKRLEGRVIGIDAGHQQKANHDSEPNAPGSAVNKAKVSSGTQGAVSKTPEYTINLIIALKLQSLLEEEGAKVVMTRTTHDVDISNKERAEIMNAAECEAVIRIHCDGNSKSTVNGAHILTPSNQVTRAIHEASEALGNCILDAFLEATGANSRGVHGRGDQTGFNWSTVPVVTIEMGYMTNPAEDARLNRESYQDKCAQGMRDGFIAYFNQF